MSRCRLLFAEVGNPEHLMTAHEVAALVGVDVVRVRTLEINRERAHRETFTINGREFYFAKRCDPKKLEVAATDWISGLTPWEAVAECWNEISGEHVSRVTVANICRCAEEKIRAALSEVA